MLLALHVFASLCCRMLPIPVDAMSLERVGEYQVWRRLMTPSSITHL